MLIRRMLRSIPSGNPVSGASVELRLEADNTLLDSTTTDGNGWYQFVLNGNPGPYYITSSFGNEVQRTSSKVVGLSGTTDVGNLGLNFRIYGDGYIPGVLSELAVSASGGSMNVTVAPGAALVRGILYDQFETLQFPIAASTIQPRIDRIVIEVIPAGAGENIEGRSRIVVKTGTPAATPTAPSLTQTTALWQIPLAQVLVDASVVAIASNKVTDERVALSVQIPDDFITTAMLKAKSVTAAKIADNTITAAQLAPDSVGSSELANNAVDTAALADNSVTAAKIAAGAVGASEIADASITNTEIANDTIMPVKMNSSWRPRTLLSRNDADANFSGAQNTLLTANFSSEAGTYTFMAFGSVRATDTSSSASPRGWARILRGGSEVGAEFFYLPGGYSGNGDGAVVFAVGTFAVGANTTDDFTLNLAVDQGIFTVNQRQLMVWLQRIS